MQGGVITERCYGCGRCFPVCPFDKISELCSLLFCYFLHFSFLIPFFCLRCTWLHWIHIFSCCCCFWNGLDNIWLNWYRCSYICKKCNCHNWTSQERQRWRCRDTYKWKVSPVKYDGRCLYVLEINPHLSRTTLLESFGHTFLYLGRVLSLENFGIIWEMQLGIWDW